MKRNSPSTQPIPVSLRRRFHWTATRVGPIVVWVVAIFLCFSLYVSESQTYSVKGIINVSQTTVTPLVDGRIAAVRAPLHSKVKQGDIVVELDATELLFERKMLEAEMAALQAQVSAERLKLERSVQEYRESRQLDERRLEVDLNNAQLAVLDRRVTIEVNKIQLSGLRLEEQRLAQLIEMGVNQSADLDRIRMEADAIEKSINENESSLIETQKQVAEARNRLAEFAANRLQAPNFAEVLAPYERQVDVMATRVELFSAQMAGLYLRSPIDGVVSASYIEAGKNVQAGLPVVQITSEDATTIVAYLPPSAPIEPYAGEDVQVGTLSNGTHRLDARVQSLGPAFEALPGRLQRNLNISEYGRPFLVKMMESDGLVPGEIVTVFFHKR